MKRTQTMRCKVMSVTPGDTVFQNLLMIWPKLSRSPTLGCFHCFQTSPQHPPGSLALSSHVLVQAALSTDPILGAGADDTSIATGGSCWET